MKKGLIPILWIALYLNPLLAQIKQGSWLLGGSMGSNRQPSFFRAWTNPKLGNNFFFTFVLQFWQKFLNLPSKIIQNGN